MNINLSVRMALPHLSACQICSNPQNCKFRIFGILFQDLDIVYKCSIFDWTYLTMIMYTEERLYETNVRSLLISVRFWHE